jgi:hypothetical protein
MGHYRERKLKIGNIVAYDCDPAKLGEILEKFTYPSGEPGVLIKPFEKTNDKFCVFEAYEKSCWVLTDSI